MVILIIRMMRQDFPLFFARFIIVISINKTYLNGLEKGGKAACAGVVI